MLFRAGLACAALLAVLGTAEAGYLGKEIGPLSQLHHAVRGRVYAVDSRTLYLHDFHYDGEGPAAYFYVGTSKTPSATGALRLRDERGSGTPLRRYRGESVTLSLPEGKTLRDVAWFSVWCDEYSINFGSVEIPRSLEFPKPAKVGALRGVHGVSSEPIVVVDAQTLLVPNFSYDGEAPDAKFWVGRGDKPSPQGIRIPDENGKEAPLRKYDRKTIVLTLPGELTVFDIGHFAVWCEAFTVNFGHVVLPRALLANVPPSLKMLGVSPQSRNQALVGEATPARAPSRPRKPLVRLDATTYRPHLRPGPPATLERPAVHPQHRRADSFTPPQHQLLADPTQQTKDDRQPYDQPLESSVQTQSDPNQQQQIESQGYNLQIQGRFQVHNEPIQQQNQQDVESQAFGQSVLGSIQSHQSQQVEQQRYADQQQTERENYDQQDQGSIQSQNEQNQNLEQQLLVNEQQMKHVNNYENQGSAQSKQNQLLEQDSFANHQETERQNHQDQGSIQSQKEENQNSEQQRLLNQQQLNQHVHNHQTQGTQAEPEGVYDENLLLEQLNFINQQVQEHALRNPKIYLNNQQFVQNVHQPQNLLDRSLSTQDLLYQQRLYEQQRRALELELQQYRQLAPQYQPAPLQYRLLPYDYEQGSDSRRNYRQADLDLLGSSGSN